MRKNRSLTTATGLVIPALKSLPIAALLLAGMTACSDDDMPGGNEAPDVSESTVTVGNDPAAQASRITFYGTPGGRSTRAAADFPEFPEVGEKAPEIPDGTPSFDSPNAARQGQGDKTNYQLTGGEGQLEMYGGNVYITGTVKTHNINCNGGGGTIHVMPGATFTLTNGNISNDYTVKIHAYGKLEVTGTNLTVGDKGQILVKDDLVVDGDLSNAGMVVVNGHLTVNGIIQSNSANAAVKGRCIGVINKNNQNDAVSMSTGGVLAVRSYLNCDGDLKLGNNGSVFLWPNAMADVTGTTIMSGNTCGFFYHSSEGKTGNHSLLNTGTLKVDGGADNPDFIGAMFANELKIKYANPIDCSNPNENRSKFPQSADDYYIPSDVNHGGCNPGNGKEDENKPFDPIAVIDGPTHSHNHLSATCIQPAPDGKRAYVSYHLNTEYKDNAQYDGENTEHQGCVELYNVSENQAEISSWLMNDDFDFNHMIVDGDMAYTVGDTKKYGATLGVINLDGNGAFGKYELDTEGRENVMKYYSLYKKTAANRGSSGNCIIRDGNFFRIASYQGFQTMDATTLAIDNNAFLATNGSAKHIANGGGYIVTLNLDQKGVESSAGTVNVYTTWGTPTATFKTEAITPIDGKNVIATDGTSIYVALGETGVAKYSMTGTLEGSYSWIEEKMQTKPDYKGKPLANGLDVDDKYVYVANGAAGMLVLDKATMKRVARYAHSYKTVDNKSYYYSANYVRKVGNLIYIAYGRDGLEIVKMREDSK